MLTYLLGDVLRIFAGDYTPGELQGQKVGQAAWLGIATFMVIPILMVVLSVTLDGNINRWTNVFVAASFFVFNFIGLPSYPGAYDKFLLLVGLGYNALTIWYAWRWK